MKVMIQSVVYLTLDSNPPMFVTNHKETHVTPIEGMIKVEINILRVNRESNTRSTVIMTTS